MAPRRAQGGPAVQRDEEYMTTERSIGAPRARQGPGAASALKTRRDSLATGILAMYPSLRDGFEPVVRRLREAIDRDDAEPTLRRLCTPTSHESCYDRGRNTT